MSSTTYSNAVSLHVNGRFVKVLKIHVAEISEGYVTLNISFQEISSSKLESIEILEYRRALHYLDVNYGYRQLYFFYLDTIVAYAHRLKF